MKYCYLLILFILIQKNSFSQISYIWNGATSTDWNTSTNWTPNGIPGSLDNVTIVTGSNNSILANNTTIANLTITSGLLNLNTFSLTTTGIVACNSGSCTNGSFNSTATSLTFAGTLFSANITATVNDVYFNGSTFNGNVTVNKTSASNIQSNGNNVFNGTTSITNSGTGYLLLTNGGVGRNETFNGTTTLNTSNTGALYIGYSRNVDINANLTVNNTAGTGLIQIGRVGTVTLNTGITITCGSFAGAALNLYNINQIGSTAQTIAPGSAGAVNIYGSNITGSLTVNAGMITAQTSTFATTVTYNMSGVTGNCPSSGGNTYNGVLRVNNSSTGYIGFGNGSPDIYNDDVYYNNTSSVGGRIIIGQNSTNNQFNGNIYVTQNGPTAAGGIAIGWGGTYPIINLAATKSIINTGVFSSGYLQLYRLSQSDATAINLTGTGTTNITLKDNVFIGNVNFTSPDITPTGSTYNGTATFNKTGGTSNHNNGNQNIFNSTCTINQTSTTGYFMLGYNSNDLFNDNIIVTNTGTQGVLLGYSSGSGTPTLASGKTVIIGGAGFSGGNLQFGGFTQLGSTPITLTLTGTAGLTVCKSSIPSTFDAAFDVTAPNITIAGGVFNGATVFTKTGGTSNHNSGVQNIFNSTLTINQQSSSGYFMLGYNSNDLFNDDITVSSISSGGIYLGYSSGSGTPILASGKTVMVGGAGFSDGFLYFGGFTQLGSAAINLNFTGLSTALNFRGSTFGGGITAVSPTFYFNSSVFNGILNITKTGNNNESSPGGNIFNGVTTMSKTGTGYLGLGWSNPDTWNSDVTFSNSGAERILPAYNSIGNLFNGNITVNSTSGAAGINFCGGAATATLAATKTIQIGGLGFDSGYLILQKFTQLGSAPISLTFLSTASYLQFGPSSSFGGNVTSSTPGLYFNGCTFSGTVNSEKFGATSDQSSGNNIFNAAVSFTNSGSGYLLLANGNPDRFNSTATFNNLGSNNIYTAYNSNGNIFNDDVTFNNNPTSTSSYILVSYSGTNTQFNGNIIVNSTLGNGVQFCQSIGTATLAASKTISIGGLGFSSGTLLLRNFTQISATPQTLIQTSGTSVLTIGPSSSFDGDVNFNFPQVYLNGATYNGLATLEKNGAGGNYSTGGNTFNKVTSIINSGSSYYLLGNSNPDVWNDDVTFTNSGSERLLPCWATVGNLFNGNIYVNTSGSAQGIQFCGGNATATATLAATKSVYSGGIGLNAGYLILKQFTQLGSAPINLTMSSTASYIQYGPLSEFGGDVTSVSPGLYFNGSKFNGTATCTKNGSSNDASIGNNIFNGITNITNSGSGYLLFGNGNVDQFNTTTTFNNNGSNYIYVAYNSTGNIFGGDVTFNNSTSSSSGYIRVAYAGINTLFNGNIIVNSTSGSGVQFCESTGTATLAATKTISVGGLGFSSGTLLLRRFYQTGPTAQSLILTGTGNLTFGPTSYFGGNVTSISPAIIYNSSVFDGTVTATKNGITNDASPGGNQFNNPFTITNTGSGYFLMGNGTPDLWNSTATFNNLSTGQHMYPAYNSNGNIFNGDVIYNNQPGSTSLWIYANPYGTNTQYNGNITLTNVNGAGIYFGSSTGTSTLSATKTVSIGASGFDSGGLIFKQFTQVGSTAQNIITTGSSYIQYGPTSAFDGTITSTSPGLLFNGSIFNGPVNSIKNGTANNSSVGGNTFNAPASFTNTGTGYLMLANTTSDAYNNDVTFTQNGTGAVYPNYNTNCTYSGNVTVSSALTPTITFGSNTSGIATFIGGSAQTINKTGTIGNPVFTRLVVNKSANDITLNTRIDVSTYLTLSQGNINTTSTNILNMKNASTTTVGNALSYINGPMNYDMALNGSRTLNFPIGKAADWRPAVLLVNHNSGTSYTYNSEVFNISADALGWTYAPTVDLVSKVHYWDIIRSVTSTGVASPTTNLSGSQTITLYYGLNDVVPDPTFLTICKNTYTAGTSWIDIGGTGATIGSGSVTSTSAPSVFNSFSRFTLGNKIGGINPLPIELLDFTATATNKNVNLDWQTASETNNSHYDIERSADGYSFEYVNTVNAYGNGNSLTKQTYHSVDPNPYENISYYRLKQTDKTGQFSYSNIVSVEFKSDSYIKIFPNPASNKIMIKASDDYNDATIKIINTIGIEIKSNARISNYNGTIDVSDLAAGIYYIIIVNGSNTESIKMNIQK